jgi:hypothetical protein
MNCNNQCHGCAYKLNAAANQEPHNRLRAAFAALGGFVFVCHDSLGWQDDLDGYPGGARGVEQKLSILMSRSKLIQAGASSDNIQRETAQLCREMRVCGGWKATVARLKAAGWFADPDIRMYRRFMAKAAARALETFLMLSDGKGRNWRERLDPEDELAVMKTRGKAKEKAGENLKRYVQFFHQEAKDAKVKLGDLL